MLSKHLARWSNNKRGNYIHKFKPKPCSEILATEKGTSKEKKFSPEIAETFFRFAANEQKKVTSSFECEITQSESKVIGRLRKSELVIITLVLGFSRQFLVSLVFRKVKRIYIRKRSVCMSSTLWLWLHICFDRNGDAQSWCKARARRNGPENNQTKNGTKSCKVHYGSSCLSRLFW